jgi:hypothetical protein
LLREQLISQACQYWDFNHRAFPIDDHTTAIVRVELGSHRPGSGGWSKDSQVQGSIKQSRQDLTLKGQGEEHVETEKMVPT